MGNTRPQPAARAKARDTMSRADSLNSMAKYGKIVPPSQQPKAKAKKKGLVGTILGALGGK